MLELPRAGRSEWRDSLPEEAFRYWSGEPVQKIQELNSSANYLYQIETAGQRWLLRFSHASRRRLEWLQAEADFLDFLLSQGVPVVQPLTSLQGQRVHAWGPFYGMAFTWSEGSTVSFYQQEVWGVNQFYELGRLIAQFHQRAAQWSGAGSEARRPEWLSLHPLPPLSELAPEEQRLAAEFEECWQELSIWPERQDYGLMHGDIQPLNLCIRADGSFTLLDFDDCSFHWLPGDLAVLLFHYLLVKSVHNRRIFAHKLMRCLLAGYREERPLAACWETRILQLLKLHSLWFYLHHIALAQQLAGPLTPEARQAFQARFLVWRGLE